MINARNAQKTIGLILKNIDAWVRLRPGRRYTVIVARQDADTLGWALGQQAITWQTRQESDIPAGTWRIVDAGPERRVNDSAQGGNRPNDSAWGGSNTPEHDTAWGGG